MKRILLSVLMVSEVLISCTIIGAQDNPVYIKFNGKTLEENRITVTGAGFGEYPQADISFGYIPINNAFQNATDGIGAIIHADPGEGIMVFPPAVNSSQAAVIRCTVRSSGPHVAFAIASVGQDENQVVNTTMPNNGAYFVDRYRRLAGAVIPPSSGYQPLVQVVNTSKTESLTVYMDNFEIYPLNEGYFYNGEFIDGDIVDPAVVHVVPGQIAPTATPTPEPTATPFPHYDPYEPDDYAEQASQFSIFNQLLHNTIRDIYPSYDLDYMVFGFIPVENVYFQSSPYYGNTKWMYEIEVESLTPGANIKFTLVQGLSTLDTYDSKGGRFFGTGYPIIKFKVSGDQGRYRITMKATPLNTFPTPTVTYTPTPRSPTPLNTPTPIYHPGQVAIIELPGLSSDAKALEMVLISAGSFQMGSPDNETGRETDEGPVHTVTISNDFFIGRYEITQAQWQAVMHNNPSEFIGPDQPVEQVSWENCQLFINELNSLGQGTFRLPTEAEWEYACRAATQTRYFWGDDPDNALTGQYAWYEENAIFGTANAGFLKSNNWLLFHISGNVWEWCQDRYGTYPAFAQTDPTGPATGEFRVIRGGAWSSSSPNDLRSANRNSYIPSLRAHDIGFRIVMLKNPS